MDYSIWEYVFSTLAFSAIVLFFLEVAWGLGRPVVVLILMIVTYTLFAATMIVTVACDVPVSLYRLARGRDSTWRVTPRALAAWSRIAGWLGPPVPREIDIRAATELRDLLLLSPTGFEIAVADLLTSQGYMNVRRVGGAGDLSVDLTGRTPAGLSVAVQCKRYIPEIRVGSPEIQKFIGMTTTHHRVDRGVFVTTSSFTKPAIDLAKKHKIQLIDGIALAEMLLARSPTTKEEDELLAELEGRRRSPDSTNSRPWAEQQRVKR